MVLSSFFSIQDHDTVINVIDAVAAGTANVFRSRRNEDRDDAEVTLGVRLCMLWRYLASERAVYLVTPLCFLKHDIWQICGLTLQL